MPSSGVAPEPDPWAAWLLRGRHGDDEENRAEQDERWSKVREGVLDRAAVREGDVTLDLGSGEGMLGFGALERAGERGEAVFVDISPGLLHTCRTRAERLGVLDRCRFVRASAEDLSAIADASVDVVTTRAVLLYVADKAQAFREVARVLRPGGRFSCQERVNSFGQPEPMHLLWGYDVSPVRELAAKVRAVYERGAPPETNPMLRFDERDLLAAAESAGFEEVHLELRADVAPPPPGDWDALKRVSQPPPYPPTTLEEAIGESLTREEAERFVAEMSRSVREGKGRLYVAVAAVWGSKAAAE
jgi:ubiquinone/menaquinone biosynthesis C-methylase UbiE